MRAHAGFTLIELIVTVAIISILSTFAVPDILRMMADYKLTSTATDLWVLLQQARIQAAREHAHVILNFDPDNDGNLEGDYLVFVDNGADPKNLWTCEADERILRRDRIPEGINFHEVSFAGGIPRTRFNSRGFPNGLGGHIYLRNSRSRYIGIHLNLNGSPRIVHSDSGEKGSWN